MNHGSGEFSASRPHPEMPANLESSYQRARQVTAEHAIKPESFILPDGTNAAKIKNAQTYVEYRRRTFGVQDSPEYKLAKSLEAALFERINNSHWFGEDVSMIMPSEYDDYANGIDGVLEFRRGQGKKYLGLGIDVSYSHQPDEKFRIIKEQIDKARLGFVDYFRNSDNSFSKPLRQLPRAVIMLNAADATRVVRDWDEGAPDTENIYPKVMLRQLEIQLEAYQAYASKLEQADTGRFALARVFVGARESVSALLRDIAAPEEITSLDNHPSVKMIISQLEQIGFLEPKPAAQA